MKYILFITLVLTFEYSFSSNAPTLNFKNMYDSFAIKKSLENLNNYYRELKKSERNIQKNKFDCDFQKDLRNSYSDLEKLKSELETILVQLQKIVPVPIENECTQEKEPKLMTQ